MADKQNETKVTLLARASFLALFEAKAFGDDPNAKKEFSGSFLVQKSDTAQLGKVKDAIMQVAKARWGEKAPQVLSTLYRDDRLCLKDGDKKDYEGYAGNMYIRASNKVRPLVLNRDKTPLTEQDGVIYSGCYVEVIMSFWAQDNKWGKRVNANLRGVRFHSDGEAFSGGGTASVDEFGDEEGASPDVAGSDGFGF